MTPDEASIRLAGVLAIKNKGKKRRVLKDLAKAARRDALRVMNERRKAAR